MEKNLYEKARHEKRMHELLKENLLLKTELAYTKGKLDSMRLYNGGLVAALKTRQMSIEGFIENIRDSSEYAKYLYTNGDCYKFYKLLCKYFPVRPYFTAFGTHIVSYLEGKYYDINGEYPTDGSDLIPLTEKDHQECDTWNFRNNNFLKIGECPACEEPLIYKEII